MATTVPAPKVAKLPPLLIGLYSRHDGSLIRQVEIPDPREGFCKFFNEESEWSRKMGNTNTSIARPITKGGE